MNHRGIFRATLVAVALVAAFGPARAEWKPTVSPECALLSRYLWRGSVLTGGAVAQPTATIGIGPVEANVWANLDLSDANDRSNEVTEIDYTGTISHPVAGFDFSAGSMTYTFTADGVNSTTEVFAGLTGPWRIAPSLTAYRDVDQAHGTYLALGLAPSFPAGSISIDTSLTLGWGSLSHNAYNYGVATEGLTDAAILLTSDLPVHQSIALRPTLGYSRLIRSSLRDVAVDADNVLFGLTIASSF